MERTMPESADSPQEVAARGEQIYEQQLRAKLEGKHHGEYLVLDIRSGAYEIDRDDLTATKRLMVRCPDAVVYGLRIGYPAAYRLGGFSRVSHR